MAIFTTVVACIALVISLINLMSIGVLVNNSITQKNTPTPEPSPVVSDDDDDRDQYEYARGYTDCREVVIGLLRLALYDMYTTHDILDYDSTSMEIFDRMDTITNDQAYQDKAMEQYKEFMGGTDDSDDH